MTSDTAKPETKPVAEPERFRSHLPAIVAATTGTVLAAILGSLIGTAGTVAGMVIGSLASGTCAWWAERGIRRSTALATARAETIRARSRELHPHEDAAVTQTAAVTPDIAATTRAAAGRHGRPRPRPRWAGPAALIATAFVGCAIVITLVEGASGKPLSAVVQGKPGHGTTLGGGAVGKASPASPSATPSASTTGGAATTPATSTTPSGVSNSPGASTAPAATAPSGTPASGTPASSTPASSAPASSAPVSSPPDSATPSATPTVPAGG